MKSYEINEIIWNYISYYIFKTLNLVQILFLFA